MSFLIALEAAAITIVFVRGTIFKRVRESGPALWRELASCPLCAGVWIGAGWYALRGAVPGPFESALTALATGAATGVLALLASLSVAVLDKHS